ncbi:MAG: glycoside hydrolase family 2 protein [Bacteroidetes bacterium]|nr:MAG: glycoside hydrolase family 2 protein [Bacteroidota bacterium]
MHKKIILAACLVLLVASSKAQIKWPAITNTTKPWTRWWWEGSAVNKKDLSWNLEQYQKAGLGGVEITPIYGVYGHEKEFIEFLSPQWMQMLVHTLSESKRLGLGVDLANATGWPFGGPWVSNADASKTIYCKTYTVHSGEKLQEIIEYKQEAMVRTANNKPAGIDSILNPVSANKNLQSLALDQIQYPGKLPLRLLMAYSELKNVLDLTDKIDANGKLNWTAPTDRGTWTLYALFEGLHGKMVERAAPGGEGYAIDHFSASAARNYFKKFDEAFKGYDLSYLRGFFNDSYEVDDARGQANWTSDFFEQFRKRKGYDLKEYLPQLFGKSNSDSAREIFYDYRSVIDELILENFTQEWKKWGASKGKIVRNQSHGSPANTLDLYSVVDIPETEGTDILRFKFATSAANVTGKKLVSSESATWLNEHFLSSLGDVKKAIDLYFLGGVNHIFYHGSAYSPKDAPWPGWLFYAAVHFQTTNPQWKDFGTLNAYITRVQSFLQSSKPDNDILLYYPIADRYSEPGNALLQHFDGMERNFENTDFEHVSKWMLEKGYDFDFFSDRQLQNFSFSGNKIWTGGNSYKAILLPANKLIPPATAKNLLSLAEKGAIILFYKQLPDGAPGMSIRRDDWLEYYPLESHLNFKEVNGARRAAKGKGQFIVSDDLEILMKQAQARKENFADKGLSVLRRRNSNGTMYFVNNRTNQPFNGSIILDEKPNAIGLFDPMTGDDGLATTRVGQNGKTEVFLALESYESVIIQLYPKKQQNSPAFVYYELTRPAIRLDHGWNLEFLNGGPVIPSKLAIDTLGSWTVLAGEDVKNFSGTASYSILFDKPAGNASIYYLDLGSVKETAEVLLNGKKIASLIGPTFQCIIPSSVLQPTNKLEIIVANLMANRIAYMDRNNIPWKIFYNTNMPARRRENVKNGLFNASDWKPLPSGLLGPVTLTPVRTE